MSEPSYRALLIGVPTYKDDRIDDLPFIEDDLTELAGALEGVGYAVDVHDSTQTGRDEIESAVEIFFQEAEPGQTLLLFLSGHGIHHNDTDYLIPRGALTRVHDFPGKCVPIDFGSYAERSAAGDIVVFVDACREGVDLREKGVGNLLSWSETRVRRVGNRHYCHVYACSKGEFASFATAGQSTFSLFSRALSTLIADESGPGTLGELQKRLQLSLDQLTSEHECRRQRVRVRAESEVDDFVVFSRPERAAPLAPGESPWAGLVREHPAWQHVADGPGAELLQETTAHLAHHLYTLTTADQERLKDDPWSVPGFAERMTERVGWLLSKIVNPKKLLLSPAEAALLVAVPFLYAAYGNRSAASALDVLPLRLDRIPDPSSARAAYEDHISHHSRLTRRAGRAAGAGDKAGAAGIAWWLFHNWLARRPQDHQEGTLHELTAPLRTAAAPATPIDARLVSDVFAPARLLTLVRGLRSAPDLAASRPVHQVARSSELEQDVREQLVVALLTVAHRSAIDPRMLGDVVVDHVGITYAVDLAALHDTLDKAGWDPRGRTRVLNAVCAHPAVGLALQQQAAALDTVLGTIDVLAGTEPQLGPLEDLPAHATADQVVAALTADGKRVYESTDLRFRLADDRVQELLMGEELYGDPALAIRELYQNALDACRYRDARTAYLRATTPGYAGSWAGTIDFLQGEEGGRAYIECRDNGVGMGERELREVFSHAGMRFADLPEYVEELARWRAKGIEMHPNSRFGIGVLSYFMIADDIQVTTCRLDPEGHPGHRLRVDIAGPGALFHIQDLGRGHESGTTVRLYLRDPATAPSAKELLRRLLWVSDFRVSAADHTDGPDEDVYIWQPRVLSEAAPLGTTDPFTRPVRDQDATAVATSAPGVWWCSSTGAILADGLWCGAPLFGGVVNLTGPKAPSLTVDRKRCLSYDAAHAQRLLVEQIPALLNSEEVILTPEWLTHLAVRHSLEVADAVLSEALAVDHQPWGVHKFAAAMSSVGCFALDSTLFGAHSSHPWPVPSGADPTSLLMEWRVLAWAKAGAYPDVSVKDPVEIPLARPLDYTLLRPNAAFAPSDYRLHLPTLNNDLLIARSALYAARRHGLAAADAARRLHELGYDLPPDMRLPDEPSEELISALDVADERHRGSRKPGAPLHPAYVLDIARRLRCTPVAAAEVLAPLGLRTPDWFNIPDGYDEADRVVVDLAGSNPLVCAAPVVQAAEDLRCSPSELIPRFERLGYQLSSFDADIDTIDADDLLMMSCDLDGVGPWLDPDAPTPWGHVLAAAERLARPAQGIVERLAQLGHTCTVPLAGSDRRAHSQDLILLSTRGDGRHPWLSERMLTPAQAMMAATRLGRSPHEIVERWRALGLRVPDTLTLPSTMEVDDLLLLSRDLNRAGPWLKAGQRVALGHVLTAAGMTGRSPQDIEARLAALGFGLPSATPLPLHPLPGDAAILSVSDSGSRIWLNADKPATLTHIVLAAATTGQTPTQVATRLAELGYTLPPNVRFDLTPTPSAPAP